MVTSAYQFVLALYRDDGSPLGEAPMLPDFEPAMNCAEFEGVRRGQLPAVLGAVGGTVEPIWDEQLREPFIGGFRVTAVAGGGETAAGDFPVSCFAGLAQRASSQCVKAGTLKPGDKFYYVVMAFRREAGPEIPPAAEEPPGAIVAEEIGQPLRLIRSPMGAFARGSSPSGQGRPEDFRVFIPKRILDETAQLVHDAGAMEVGGVLIGHLHRDITVSTDVFLEITAQIPGRHVRSELTRLVFTAETWAAARGAVELRGRREIWAGWWHAHSYLKQLQGKDGDGGRARDSSAAAFMSTEDIALHRTLFARAYSVALVVSSTREDITWSLFGWRDGMVASRSFDMLQASPSETPLTADAPAAEKVGT